MEEKGFFIFTLVPRDLSLFMLFPLTLGHGVSLHPTLNVLQDGSFPFPLNWYFPLIGTVHPITACSLSPSLLFFTLTVLATEFP